MEFFRHAHGCRGRVSVCVVGQSCMDTEAKGVHETLRCMRASTGCVCVRHAIATKAMQRHQTI
eukprot:8591219-Alexandrium_andersonii.AAC.1